MTEVSVGRKEPMAPAPPLSSFVRQERGEDTGGS